MQLFEATQKPGSATVSTAALRELDDFASCSEAAARLSELLQQRNELEVQLAAATRRIAQPRGVKKIPGPLTGCFELGCMANKPAQAG